jgi:hypothetical protein
LARGSLEQLLARPRPAGVISPDIKADSALKSSVSPE